MSKPMETDAPASRKRKRTTKTGDAPPEPVDDGAGVGAPATTEAGAAGAAAVDAGQESNSEEDSEHNDGNHGEGGNEEEDVDDNNRDKKKPRTTEETPAAKHVYSIFEVDPEHVITDRREVQRRFPINVPNNRPTGVTIKVAKNDSKEFMLYISFVTGSGARTDQFAGLFCGQYLTGNTRTKRKYAAESPAGSKIEILMSLILADHAPAALRDHIRITVPGGDKASYYPTDEQIIWLCGEFDRLRREIDYKISLEIIACKHAGIVPKVQALFDAHKTELAALEGVALLTRKAEIIREEAAFYAPLVNWKGWSRGMSAEPPVHSGMIAATNQLVTLKIDAPEGQSNDDRKKQIEETMAKRAKQLPRLMDVAKTVAAYQKQLDEGTIDYWGIVKNELYYVEPTPENPDPEQSTAWMQRCATLPAFADKPKKWCEEARSSGVSVEQLLEDLTSAAAAELAAMVAIGGLDKHSAKLPVAVTGRSYRDESDKLITPTHEVYGVPRHMRAFVYGAHPTCSTPEKIAIMNVKPPPQNSPVWAQVQFRCSVTDSKLGIRVVPKGILKAVQYVGEQLPGFESTQEPYEGDESECFVPSDAVNTTFKPPARRATAGPAN